MTNEELIMQYQLSEDYNVLEAIIDKNMDVIVAMTNKHKDIQDKQLLIESGVSVLINCIKKYQVLSDKRLSFNNFFIVNLRRKYKHILNCLICDDLVKQYQQGNKILIDDILKICFPIVERIAKEYTFKYTTIYSIDDAKQTGLMAVMKAAERFELHSTPFIVGVKTYIEYDIIVAAKKGTWLKPISLNAPSNDGEGDEIGDIIPCDINEIALIIDNLTDEYYKHELEKALNGALSVNERNVIGLIYGLDGLERHTYIEIAHLLNISDDKVRDVESRALRQLRVFLKGIPWYEDLKKERRIELINYKYNFDDFVLG